MEEAWIWLVGDRNRGVTESRLPCDGVGSSNAEASLWVPTVAGQGVQVRESGMWLGGRGWVVATLGLVSGCL